MAQAPLIPFDYLERQKRRAAVQTQTDDPIAKAMGVMRDEQVRSIIHQSPGPDLTAKVTQASRATGEPPALIEDKLPDIERSQQADYMTGLFGRFPALAKWAAGDPRGVAAAADDHKALGILGEAWDFLKKVPGRLGAGTYSAGAGLRELTDPIANAGAYVNAVVQAPIQTVLDAQGINKGYDPFAAAAKSVAANDASRAQMRGEAERIRKANKSENQYADALLSGFESIPLTIGAIFTRNPEMATGLMGGSVGGQGYRDARDKGLPVGTSIVYGGLQGGFEKLTEGIPASSLIEGLARKTPFGKVFVEQLAQELPGEQVATVLQDFTEWAYLNPDKPFSQFVAERPAAAVNTALATLTGTASVTGATVALDRTAQAASKVASRVEQSRVAKAHGTFFDKAGKAAEQSKLRERDPEAYAAAIRAQAEETGAKFVYIPGEAAQAYMQSDAYDPDGDPFSAWADDAGEAYASGGDIVIPIEQALTQLPGSPAWAALKDDMRLVAGGISAREAQTFDDAIGEIMGAMTDQMAAQDAAEAKGRTVRQKLLDSVAGMLGTGYTSPVARSLAELAVSRVETRAAALGQELTGNEFDNLEIRTVLPESVALAKSADSLDLTINAMRGGKPAERQSGPTLTEWIAKRGGINDSGGDIASMGGDKWHKGKVGRRKLIRPFDPQASMGGISGAGDYGVDTTLRAAVAEGFFPELAGQDVQSLDTGALLEALASEFSGKPRFASEVVTDTARAAADDLRQYLEAQGYNPDEMGDGDIRAIIQAGQGQSEQDGYEQLPGTVEIDGVERPTRNSEGMPLAGSVEGVRAFYKWFGDSKVVDDEGRPLVVYHGTQKAGFEAFDTSNFSFFTNRETVAASYSGTLDEMVNEDFGAQDEFDISANYAVYLRMEDVLDVDWNGRQWGDGPQGMRTDDWASRSRSEGRDGLIVRNVDDTGYTAPGFVWDEEAKKYDGLGDIFVAFAPTQIKSINNRGTFDPADARILYQAAYHGSPHIFDRFSLDAIGTGEGAQVYGWGLYFAGRKEIAEHYRRALSGRGNVQIDGTDLLTFLEQSPAELREVAKSVALDFYEYEGATREQQEQANQSFGWAAFVRALDQVRAQRAGFPDLAQTFNYISARFEKEANQKTDLRDKLSDLLVSAYARALGQSDRLTIEDPGRLYQVEIPDEGEYLLWDKPLSEQPEKVRAAIHELKGGDKDADQLTDDELFAALGGFEQALGDKEKSGQGFYRELVSDFAAKAREAVRNGEYIADTDSWAQKQASLFLHGFGIAGIKYLDGGSRTAGDGSFNYVVFDDSRVSITAYEQEAKGRIIFDGPRRIIELFQTRNLSTAIHEFGHMWLEELAFDATTSEASDQLKADWETVKAWFADNGHAVDGAIPVEAHEMWARGVERYVMEGKAPTTGLKRLFETVRTWMLSIYKTVEALRAPITPEIRSVMDRLLATDEQIAAMREDQALSALFNNAADIGMSEAEFAAYREQVADARAEAQGKVLEKAMRSERAKTTKEYREARKAVRADVEADVLTRPMFRAFDLLKTQPMDAGWIRDEMGEDALALLPKRVPPVYTDGGANPSTIAELAGYATGKQMIEALIGAEITHRQLKEGGDQRTLRNRMIDTETDAEMNRRYGDPLNDGSIEREALAAVHNEKQGEVIASELRVLARKTGNRPTPYAMAREWARGRIRGGVVAVEASPGAIERYRRAAAKAGRLAEGAMLEQNADEAFRQKQLQMLNNALVSEAKAAADEVEGAVKRMGKIAARKTMKSVDQDYLEQAQALLEAVDLKRRSQKGIERQGSWEAWAAEREAEGFDVAVPASFEATINRTNWTRLTVEQLLMLDEAVKQVMHLGRLKQRLLDNQEEREWEEIFTEAVSSAGGLDQRPPRGSFDEPTWWDNIKARVATVDAALLKMETVFDWLDRGNPNGVFNRIVFRPMAEAQANESAMLADYYGRIKEAMGRVPKETLRKWDEKVTLDLLDPATGLPITMSRQKLVSMALNIGNEGNLQRLTDGYGWNANGVMAALNDNLTEPEWRFVQETWDVINTLWPQIEAMERDINGFAPEKVDPRPVETPFGVLAGGYYPAIYDSSLDLKAEEQAGKRADLFEANYVRATTRASATKDRAEKVRRPILLDLGVINRHLGEVIHDVTHRRAIMQAHRFLTNERVARAVEQALGPEVRKQFRPWLKHIANSWAMERAGSEGIGRFLSKLRANTTVVGMGFRFTTMLTQVAGYSNSFEVVGERWVAPAIAQVAAHPVKSFEFVMERSDEVRFRMDNLDRDIRQSLAELSGKASPLTAAKRFAFHGIGYMDRVVVIPTWIGAYNKALSEGMTEQDAAYSADKAVRQSQGAGAPKDLAAIQTGAGRFGELFKYMTMFYSYMSAMYQRQRTLGRDIKGTRDLPRLLARTWWLVVVPPLLSALLTGNGPDDDEDWGFWTLRKMLGNALGPIPVVRDVFEPAWHKFAGTKGFDYQMSPVQSAMKSFVNVAGDAGNIVQGEETKRATRDVLETAGYATGLVPGQIAASTQFLVDVGSGDADPDGFWDWYTGLTKGRLPED